MAYEYKVPVVDFTRGVENLDADAFFDTIHVELDNKLSLKSESSINDSLSESGAAQVTAEENREKTSSAESSNPETILSDSPLSVKDSIEDTSVRNGANDRNENERWEGAVLKEITENLQNITNLPKSKKRKSDNDYRTVKYISLAEAVSDFQGHIRDTHFRRISGKVKKSRVLSTHVTIPQSPLLLCKARSRPVDYPTAEERMQKELEEIQSFKLKANPVNKKIFATPKLGKKVPRTPLVVKPFKLTEYHKKEFKPPSSPFYFKAKPAPTAMFQHPTGVPEKKILPITNPQTPSFVSKQKIRFETIEEVNGKLSVTEHSPTHTNVPIPKAHLSKTRVCPFSFEQRDKLMVERKEDKIKKVLQEEKEARIFHAKPLPAFMKKIVSEAHSSSRSSQMSDKDEERVKFKAQPALVLQKPPFTPILPEKSLRQPDDVVLHTEQRSHSRKEFEEHLKEKEEYIEAVLRQRKELKEKEMEEEVARLRQQAVHKAQPIRSYKPVPEKQKPAITSPVTPKFSQRFKK